MTTVSRAQLTLLLAAFIAMPVFAQSSVLGAEGAAASGTEKTEAPAAGSTSQEAPADAAVQSSAKGKGGEEADKRPYKEEAIRHYNHGHDLHQQGFFNQAIAEYKSAIAADDRMEEAWTNLGLIYAAQRNYSKAIDAFKKSLILRPTRPNALNGLGTVLYANKKFPEAMEKWKEAVKIDPHFASAYYNMGNALENEKDFNGAVDNYAHALEVNPSMADAYYRIGSIFAKQKHPAQADLLLSKAIKLEPSGEFVHDARKLLDSMQGEFSKEDKDSQGGPEVKMNIMAPPSAQDGKDKSNEQTTGTAAPAAPVGAARTEKTW
jgi:tetratricopeptide (TPR) repeat protein